MPNNVKDWCERNYIVLRRLNDMTTYCLTCEGQQTDNYYYIKNSNKVESMYWCPNHLAFVAVCN